MRSRAASIIPGLSAQVESSASDDIDLLQPALRVLSGADRANFKLVPAKAAAAKQVVARFVAVPSLSNPRALLDLDAKPTAWGAALKPHANGAESRIARVVAEALRLATRFGLKVVPFKDRVALVTSASDSDVPMRSRLAKVMGTRDFHMNLRLAPGRPNSKPVVQIVSYSGEVLAFAKFGWDPLTKRLMRAEAETLLALAPKVAGSGIQLPQVLHSGAWNGLELLVVSTLTQMGRTPWNAEDGLAAAAAVVSSLEPTRRARLSDSTFWQRLSEHAHRSAALLSPTSSRTLLDATDWIEGEWGGVEMTFGRSHGDWIPPNISIRPDGAYNIWDWERSEPEVPVGVDPLQFILFSETRKSPASRDLVRCVETRGRLALRAMDLDPDLAGFLAPLSLLRSLLWYAEAREASRGWSDDNRVVSALDAFLATKTEGATALKRTSTKSGSTAALAHAPSHATKFNVKVSSNEN